VPRFRLTDGTSAARLTLAVDLAALALFVVAGMRSHRTASQMEIFARNAVPIGGAWLATALAVGTYRPPSLKRLVLTWAIAVPVGVLVRSWWTGSPDGDDLLVFGGVAMTFTLAFLAGGRLVTNLLAPRLGAPSRP
jgi:Protein of unknown function (DUF3054)